jgi:hypothetical protein
MQEETENLYKFIHFHPDQNRFSVVLPRYKKRTRVLHYLGSYPTLFDATQARDAALSSFGR